MNEDDEISASENPEPGEAVPPAERNVLGGPLVPCSRFPMTGFFRDGLCRTCPEDVGRHTVCVEVTERFLAFSRRAGNDLTSPRPDLDFPGLIPGDRWCLCLLRWIQALRAGEAPPVVLEATHHSVLDLIDLRILKAHAVPLESRWDPGM